MPGSVDTDTPVWRFSSIVKRHQATGFVQTFGFVANSGCGLATIPPNIVNPREH
jgi:hypothetical protein